MKSWFTFLVVVLNLSASTHAATEGRTTTTLYINRHFEVRDHEQPVKYVFNRDTRISRVVGSLSAAPRVQRLRFFNGWNLCSLALTATNMLGQLSNSSEGVLSVDKAFSWDMTTRSWMTVAPGQTLPAGAVLWIYANTNVVLPIIGDYSEPTNRQLDPDGAFLPSAGLEAWKLGAMCSNHTAALFATFDASTDAWLSSLPAPRARATNFPSCLPPGGALFAQGDGATALELPAPALRVLYYHQDHLGSSGVVADSEGRVIEETTFYPFGTRRHRHAVDALPEPYQFTQKECDAESALHQVGLRYLPAALARFASPDPKYLHPDKLDSASAQNFLRQPQALNLYAYALSNPLKFIDPTGLEVVWAEGLTKDKAFQKALKILEDTVEGKRILEALENADVRADVGKLPGGHGVEESGHAHMSASIEGTRTRKRREATTAITIDLAKAKKLGLTPYELANVLHHELRHAEIHHLVRPDDTTDDGIAREDARRKREHKDLDVYVPLNARNGRGSGVQTLDQRNADFQKEIKLLPENYLKND